ncbi:MAG TPA: Fic family protein [Acidimicrobiales bacterium]
MIYEIPSVGAEEQAAQARIGELRRELKYHVAEPRRWVGSVRRILSARAIQGSNSIEGYNVSAEDAVAAVEGDEPAEATLESWQAVTGYRRAITYVLQLAQDPYFEFTAQLLRSLHFMMTENSLDASPGRWRPGAVWVRNDATREVVYEAPDADQIPDLIEELMNQLSLNPDVPVLVRAAMAHLNLVMIHPYRDGNGRMARCLQTLVLTQDGILSPEFCSIEEFLGANTQDYYDVLRRVGEGRWNPEHDAREWVRYCLVAHFVQATSVLRRVRESEQVWGELESLIELHRLAPRSIAALFDATSGLKVRNASYRTTLKSWEEEVSNQVATTDLRAMVQAGLLEQQGKKRGTYYTAGTRLRELRATYMTGRQRIDTSTLFDPIESELPFG